MINMQQLMQQAQAMQKKLQSNQEKMKNTDFTADSGNGKVKITINGVLDIKKVEIDPELLDKDNKEILEDLILVAFNNVKKKVDSENNNSFGNLAGGSNMLNGLF